MHSPRAAALRLFRWSGDTRQRHKANHHDQGHQQAYDSFFHVHSLSERDIGSLVLLVAADAEELAVAGVRVGGFPVFRGAEIGVPAEKAVLCPSPVAWPGVFFPQGTTVGFRNDPEALLCIAVLLQCSHLLRRKQIFQMITV